MPSNTKKSVVYNQLQTILILLVTGASEVKAGEPDRTPPKPFRRLPGRCRNRTQYITSPKIRY